LLPVFSLSSKRAKGEATSSLKLVLPRPPINSFLVYPKQNSAEETIQFAKSKLKIEFIPVWKWLLEKGWQGHAPAKKGQAKKQKTGLTKQEVV